MEDIVSEVHEKYRIKLDVDLMTDIAIPHFNASVSSPDTSNFIVDASLLFIDKNSFKKNLKEV